jgi:hypothetical protein
MSRQQAAGGSVRLQTEYSLMLNNNENDRDDSCAMPNLLSNGVVIDEEGVKTKNELSTLNETSTVMIRL